MNRSCCVPLIVGWVILTVLTGCVHQASYGRFSKDGQVDHAFRSGTVPSDLKYYYAGRESMPYAIMGIDPGYTVTSRFWTRFELDPEHIRDISSNIYGKDRYDPYGFNILGPDGAVIGIWFSSLHFPSVQVHQETRTVEVGYKNLESYEDY